MTILPKELTQDLLLWLSVNIGGVLAAAMFVFSIFKALAEALAARRKLKNAAEENAFSSALNSSDLNHVGEYLTSTLAPFTVKEYSDSEKVEDRVNKIIARLIEFVGDETQVAKKGVPQPPERTIQATTYNEKNAVDVEAPKGSTLPNGVEKELEEAGKAIEDGEVWNGLARLRRTIEIQLRSFAESKGLKGRHLTSAGQMLRMLSEREWISPLASSNLEYAVRICNRGVHGFDVPIEIAQEALWNAMNGLDLLRRQQAASVKFP